MWKGSGLEGARQHTEVVIGWGRENEGEPCGESGG